MLARLKGFAFVALLSVGMWWLGAATNADSVMCPVNIDLAGWPDVPAHAHDQRGRTAFVPMPKPIQQLVATGA